MASSSVAIVVVVLGGATVPASTDSAIATAAESALDAGSSVIVSRKQEDVDLDSTLANARTDAAATIVWTDSLHAHLRVRSRSERAVERDVAFAEKDSIEDRARTIGFLVATIVARPLSAVETPVAQAPQKQETPPPPPATQLPAEAAPVHVVAIDASVAGAEGIGGPAMALGGELGARPHLSRWLDARAGVMLGAGHISEVDASSTTLRLKAGAVAKLISGSPSVAARFDAVAARHTLSTPMGSGARWVPCIAPGVEIAIDLRSAWSAFASLGVEVAAGNTRILVGDEQRATIPVVRFIGNLGLSIDL